MEGNVTPPLQASPISPAPTQPIPTCPACQFQIHPIFFFCPNCGKVLRPKPLPTSLGKQMSLYLVSFLLPPFGLWPAFKYLFQKDTKSKVVGIVAIILTGLSLAIGTYYTLQLMSSFNSMLGSLTQGF